MPREDGTGPYGQGPGTGRGLGRGSGTGRMGGNRPGAGPSGGLCASQLWKKIPHQAGVPCYDLTCPKCGAKMIRE
jgi:hypothetical protein